MHCLLHFDFTLQVFRSAFRELRKKMWRTKNWRSDHDISIFWSCRIARVFPKQLYCNLNILLFQKAPADKTAVDRSNFTLCHLPQSKDIIRLIDKHTASCTLIDLPTLLPASSSSRLVVPHQQKLASWVVRQWHDASSGHMQKNASIRQV